MSNILTITLNPALDLSSAVDRVLPGLKLRCTTPELDPGGGGLNVSRAIALLGGNSRAFVALGGTVGQRLTALLDSEGIEITSFDIEGETRQSLSVISTIRAEQYRFVFPGPFWSTTQVAAALKAIETDARGCKILVISGSLPPGVPVDFPATVANKVSSANTRIIIDISGAPLAWLVNNPSGIDILRMDAEEADTLTGKSLHSREDSAEFARMLITGGVAKVVIIARGSDGSILTTSEETYHGICEVSDVRSKVGAGDSFVGALAIASEKREKWPEVLRHGVAAASAAVTTDGTRLCQGDDFRKLLANTKITRL